MLLHRFTPQAAAPPKDVASPTPPTSQLLLSDSCLSILKHHGVIAPATHHWMSLAYTYRGLGMESGGSALRPKLSFLHVVSPTFACRSRHRSATKLVYLRGKWPKKPSWLTGVIRYPAIAQQ